MDETDSFELRRLLPGDVIVIKSDANHFVIAVAMVHPHAIIGILSEMSESELVDTAGIAILGSCFHDTPVTASPFSPMVLTENETLLVRRNANPYEYYVGYCQISRGGEVIFEAGLPM